MKAQKKRSVHQLANFDLPACFGIGCFGKDNFGVYIGPPRMALNHVPCGQLFFAKSLCFIEGRFWNIG